MVHCRPVGNRLAHVGDIQMRYFIVSFLLTVSFGLAFSQTPETVPAVWPTTNQFPACSNSAAFSCPATCSGGDSRFSFQTMTVVGNSVPPLRGQRYYGWSDGGTNMSCYVYPQDPYCPPGYKPDGPDTCRKESPCATKAGQWDNGGSPSSVNLPGPLPFYSGESGGTVGMPDSICLDGCVADTTQDRGEGMATSSWWGYNMNPKYNGQSCSGGSPQKPASSKPKTSPEYDCVSKGQGFGYFNGVVMCVKPDTSSGAAKKSTETKNPDGTKTKVDTATNISCNAQGACSTTITTTTTVINADGTTASTKTESKKEESQGSPGAGAGEGTGFCKENPTSPMCKTGTFGGDCEAGFTCEGDPVGCATARASWMRYCQSKWMKPGNPAASTTTLTEKKILPQGGIIPVSIQENGQCPADRSFSIAGRTVTFSYSTFCDFLGMIRPVIIAAGWLVAAYIVFGLGQKSE